MKTPAPVATPPPAPAPKTTLKVAAAKGRPMLSWVGKRPLRRVTAFPAQLVERFSADGADADAGGRLYHGDNKEVLAHLLANGYRGKVDLVYIDPPFDSGADYVRKVTLRGPVGTAKMDGETYTLGEQVQYTDIWANDNYLQFMYERLLLLRELLSESGSLYLHCDWNKAHQLRCLLEEVFGHDGFRNEVIWQRVAARSDSATYNHIHDVILFCTKSQEFVWNQQYHEYSDKYLDDKYSLVDDRGRKYQLDNLTSPNPRPNMTYEWMGHEPPEKGWRYSKAAMQELHDSGRIWYPNDQRKRPRLIRYLDEGKGVPLRSIWTDINPVNSQADERSEYPTQKPVALLDRIIETSTESGHLVLDCFIGSGTTAAVAQRLGRRWIGCDINKGAIQTTSKRLQAIMREQVASTKAAATKVKQGSLLPGPDAVGAPQPAQLGFTTWRVNDYDLQIQHNEAVALACEHIGVQRTRTDSFFDGTLGKALMKITPFDHPLSPLDVAEVQRELESRPSEDRAVTLVCLGIESAAQAAIADWNRLRRGVRSANRLDVIELRTDAKYGRFLRHMPAAAQVRVTRSKQTLVVDLQDFLSPSIIERLRDQAGVLQPRVDDWRAMVDSVAIDTAYDGNVFNVVLADVPERKTDLVAGRYELEAPDAPTTVAVRITDMLGEDVIVTTLV